MPPTARGGCAVARRAARCATKLAAACSCRAGTRSQEGRRRSCTACRTGYRHVPNSAGRATKGTERISALRPRQPTSSRSMRPTRRAPCTFRKSGTRWTSSVTLAGAGICATRNPPTTGTAPGTTLSRAVALHPRRPDARISGSADGRRLSTGARHSYDQGRGWRCVTGVQRSTARAEAELLRSASPGRPMVQLAGLRLVAGLRDHALARASTAFACLSKSMVVGSKGSPTH